MYCCLSACLKRVWPPCSCVPASYSTTVTPYPSLSFAQVFPSWTTLQICCLNTPPPATSPHLFKSFVLKEFTLLDSSQKENWIRCSHQHILHAVYKGGKLNLRAVAQTVTKDIYVTLAVVIVVCCGWTILIFTFIVVCEYSDANLVLPS